jgi:hypothetical protein
MRCAAAPTASLVNACRGGGCDFRLGDRWTSERLLGEREPHLRRSVPPLATATLLLGSATTAAHWPLRWPNSEPGSKPSGLRPTDFHPICGELHIMLKPAAIVGQVILYGAFAAFIGYFRHLADLPPDSRRRRADQACRSATSATANAASGHPKSWPRCRRTCARRWTARASARTSGSKSTSTAAVFRTVLHPTGLYKDGVSTIYKRFEVKAGSTSWRSG